MMLLARIKRKIQYYNKSLIKTKKIKTLLKSKKLVICNLNLVWNINCRHHVDIYNAEVDHSNLINIFGCQLKLKGLQWHRDYISGFEYPVNRVDKIKIKKWYDKGIDVKFPWEVSRSYFLVRLAQNFIIMKDEKNYLLFKNMIIDWIEKNPFCFGVNWYCSMEVAIRAINWIVAVNMYKDKIINDIDLYKLFSMTLVQHARYISLLPEIYDNNHTTNHTTANYVGLLFLAITLKHYPDSDKWLNQAVKGLEDCIDYQTYEDGMNFEASIPYHRLILEMFAYAAIFAKVNDIRFSNRYYRLLFKMFEYSAAYMDHNGYAPQVGDNDSGRILILHDTDEHDHSYLLNIGEYIFNYKFLSQCNRKNSNLIKWLPEIEKIEIEKLDIKPRDTTKSVMFKDGGAYFLKNDIFSLMVACFPLGQKGRGGHNHIDSGSFTLSISGNPIIVDAGTYSYSSSIDERNIFRDIYYHNVPIPYQRKKNMLTSKKIWELKNYCISEILSFNDTSLTIKLKRLDKNITIIRKFEIIEKFKIRVSDYYDGMYTIRLNLNPRMNIVKNKEKFIDLGKYYIKIFNIHSKNIDNYYYSSGYGVKLLGKKININAYKNYNLEIVIKK